jgi:hypothetical protein
VELRKKVLGPEHPDTLKAMVNFAAILGMEKKYAEAEKEGREALTIARRVLGKKDPIVGIALYNLGAMAGIRGQTDEGIALLYESIESGLPPDALANMEKDPDLKALRGNPRFPALIARAKVAAGSKK